MEVIERRIYLIRGQKVMLDSGLAWLYQVETFNLNKTDLQTQGRLSVLIGLAGRSEPEKAGVGGSIPSLATTLTHSFLVTYSRRFRA